MSTRPPVEYRPEYNPEPRYCTCGARISGYNPESTCDPCSRSLRLATWEAEATLQAMKEIRSTKYVEMLNASRLEKILAANKPKIDRRRRPRGHA